MLCLGPLIEGTLLTAYFCCFVCRRYAVRHHGHPSRARHHRISLHRPLLHADWRTLLRGLHGRRAAFLHLPWPGRFQPVFLGLVGCSPSSLAW